MAQIGQAKIVACSSGEEYEYKDVAGVQTRGFRSVRFITYEAPCDSDGINGPIANPGLGWVRLNPSTTTPFGEVNGYVRETWKLVSEWQADTPAYAVPLAAWDSLPSAPPPPVWP